MKFQFDPNEEYQLAAVRAVTDVFAGQPLRGSSLNLPYALQLEASSIELTGNAVANRLALTEEQLLQNVRSVQRGNGLPESSELEAAVSDDGKTRFSPLNFSIEMETGTGKTYTYIRTIYELNARYGFCKFVIVVPSVAIREGVMKSLDMTEAHFQELYDRPRANATLYDPTRLTELRYFAERDALQILVINIDAFAKADNIINQVKERGYAPAEHLRAARPVVIIDEPQNFETDLRKAAIASLNPLCALRYSATHRNAYNMLYALDPARASDLGLVKQIEVDGVTAQDDLNAAYVNLKKITAGKTSIKAQVEIYANDEKSGVKKKKATVAPGEDLFINSNRREIYREGWIVDEIDAEHGKVSFSGKQTAWLNQPLGGLTDELMKFQLERTVKHHLDKMKKLAPQGVKVLSLIFIDAVADYRIYEADGAHRNGRLAEWFEEIYSRLAAAPEYESLIQFKPSEIHNGYFAKDKKGKGKQKREYWVDSTGKENERDREAFALIMQNKEQLLDPEEPLQFIFSHSALREGWDNPNVFQICTLSESSSELKKRQEIGRGLRLPVGADGRRIRDKKLNVLTVVANETYDDFARQLQLEVEQETGVSFSDRIRNAREKARVARNRGFSPEDNPLLWEIWDKISFQTRYEIDFETDRFIARAVADVRNMGEIRPPRLQSAVARLTYGETGIETDLRSAKSQTPEQAAAPVPDVFAYLQSRVRLSREVVSRVLLACGRLEDLFKNPQMFLDLAARCLQSALNAEIVEGIKYQIRRDARYEMQLFEREEIETYLSSLYEAVNPEKTLYNFVPVDSEVERRFAMDCDVGEAVKFFFKLPRGFRIDTPVGSYAPDWALICENERRVYFVAETKGTTDPDQLRAVEAMKITCAEAHFRAVAADSDPPLTYRLVNKLSDIV